MVVQSLNITTVEELETVGQTAGVCERWVLFERAKNEGLE
jgi:hypothetical protein